MVRAFAAEYSNDVVGVVLVDAGAHTMSSFINGKWEGPFDKVEPRQIPSPRGENYLAEVGGASGTLAFLFGAAKRGPKSE